MGWLLVVAGVLLVLVGIADVFLTVLYYDGFGFLSSQLYNWLFRAVRALTRPLPRVYRAAGLSLGAPLAVPVTITVWISLVLSGYALIYYAGMTAESFRLQPGLEPSLRSAFYVSGTSISTLGFGDVTPASGVYQLLAVSESLIGFGILTLAVSYVVGVYAVLGRLSELSAGLYHQAQDTGDPFSILVPHFPEGEPRALDSHLLELHRGLVSLHEGMRRYPIVYYFHSRRAYRSLPYAFRMIGGMSGALRWGLPADHPAAQGPYLPTLLTGLDDAIEYVERRFLPKSLGLAPEPAPFEAFAAAFEGREDATDFLTGRFLEMERFMRELARLETAPPPEEAYERYKEWLPFAHRSRVFFEAAADDQGYELKELTGRPGELLF